MPDWVRHVLRLTVRPEFVAGIAAFSALSFIASVIGIPIYLRRLPADYFSRREQFRYGLEGQASRSVLWITRTVLRNTVGGILALAGIAMLVLPGQGLLTLLVGLMIMDFPGKKHLQRRILALPPVFRAANALRARAGEPPFRLAPEGEPPASVR